MTFNNQEKRVISILLALLYFIPATLEWLQFDKNLLPIIAISLPIWLIFFHVGPFWLFYVMQKTKWVGNLNVVVQGGLFVALMFVGAHLVSRLHLLAFSGYQFSLAEQFVSALLWGVFIFSMAQMYLLYLRLVSEQKLRKEAQWINLSHRLNPHFLFNSLNTISALIYASPRKADEVLHQLADILRYAVDQQEAWVPLAQELSICRAYLTIEASRFTDQLIVNWQLEAELDPALYRVPPLLLQPLIENVMKHVKQRPIRLDIGLHVQADQLIFQVQDNGHGFDEAVLNNKAKTGQGLDIVKQRVAIAGGAMKVFNQGGAVCKISLPIHQCA